MSQCSTPSIIQVHYALSPCKLQAHLSALEAQRMQRELQTGPTSLAVEEEQPTPSLCGSSPKVIEETVSFHLAQPWIPSILSPPSNRLLAAKRCTSHRYS